MAKNFSSPVSFSICVTVANDLLQEHHIVDVDEVFGCICEVIETCGYEVSNLMVGYADDFQYEKVVSLDVKGIGQVCFKGNLADGFLYAEGYKFVPKNEPMTDNKVKELIDFINDEEAEFEDFYGVLNKR